MYSAASAAFVAGTTIASAAVNADIADIVTDLNTARPVTAGGTGATSVIGAWDGIAKGGTDIASASTINLTTATGPILNLTGNTTVTAVTLANQSVRMLRVTGSAVQFTASATLLVNGSALNGSFSFQNGELIMVQGLASGAAVWAIGQIDGARYAPGTLYGLTPSTNAGSATNKLDFAIGAARDSSDAANIDVTAAITAKDLSVAWAVGSTAGLLATGVAVTNTTYYLFAIKRPDTGVVDFAADTSSTGANIATNTNANYTLKSLVGLVVRTGGVNAAPIWLGAGSTRTTVYTASGTHTITPGAKRLFIRAVGGGGSGGGIGGAGGSGISGGGGGSGSYSEASVSAATFGASQTVTVGAGGAVATNASGNSGGATSVGTLITANGGSGGQAAAGPGAGGAAGTGDLAIAGNAGSGGAYGATQNAIAGGSGGPAALGGGGAGAYALNAQGVAGSAGTRGGGGGGSAANNAATNPASGAGGTGEVIIVETF